MRRFACKEERAKCNLDYHSNQDLCTASAYASGCDSLENCLRCWYWKFMRITSAGDAEVTARARASPRPKPFVADENYTPRNRLTALLSMTPPFIYIFFSLFLSFFIPLFLLYPFPPVCRNIRKRKKRRSFVGYCIHSYDFFILFSIHSRNYVIILSVPMLYVVSVFRNEDVYDLFRIYFTFFSLSLLFYEEPDAREEDEKYIFFESRILVTPCYRIEGNTLSSRAPREITRLFFFLVEL